MPSIPPYVRAIGVSLLLLAGSVAPTSAATPMPSAAPTQTATPVSSLSPSATPVASSTPSPAPGAAASGDPRAFPQTGFRIDQNAIWAYFQQRGGVASFGYPTSDTFELLGLKVQMFQRGILQIRPDGGVQTMNLLDPGLLPFTHFNGSSVPGADQSLTSAAPSPGTPDYLDAVVSFVQANAPDTFDGHQVNFAETFFNTVPSSAAFGDQPPANARSLLAGFALEVWGFPTSQPAYDPNNHGFIYQRFQRGIMHYDASCDCTQGLLLADYLKDLMLNQGVPSDLMAEARSSPFLAQWAPGRPQSLARPADLPGTDLTNAFVNLAGAAPPAAPQPAPTSVPTATSTPPAPTPPPTPTAVPSPTATPTPPPPQGYDISYPGCGQSVPTDNLFVVVGVNGGKVFTGNSCLASEVAWAQQSSSPNLPHLSFYLNTGNPGPSDTDHWPAAGTNTPQACDGSFSPSCAYDFGWAAAADSYSRAVAVVGQTAKSVPWWLDVETDNSWDTDTMLNVANLEGSVAYLKSVGIGTIGIYSSLGMWWTPITGADSPSSPINAPFQGLLNWVPGGVSADQAGQSCSRSFSGGRVKLVQYPAGGIDGDYACY